MRRLQPALAKVDGITLYMQPVQDLTVEDRVSRTQYQYTLEDPDADELSLGRRGWSTSCKALPQLRDVATDQQTAASASDACHRSRTASRLGITPQVIDDALYDAFGQRQISTLFTQLNQYHVVLEALPEFQQTAIGRICRQHSSTSHQLRSDTSVAIAPSTSAQPEPSAPSTTTSVPTTSTSWAASASQHVHAFESAPRPSPSTIRGNSRRDDLVQPRAGSLAGRGHEGDRADAQRNLACR